MKIEEIIKGCVKQDLKAQRLLYEKYSGQLYPLCVRYCKDEQSASSALHAGFLNVYKNISSLENKGKLEAWMRRIVVNACINQIKSDKKFVFEEVQEEHVVASMKLDFFPSSSNKYLPLLNHLPEGYRIVFNLRVLEELSHKEIARALGISESTSRTQFFKARNLLKKIIDSAQVII